ncbi:MAG: MBL fold metallo-hydrolase [Rhodospirillales bacterium]|nr:MBL fold metallo-hydrolase [Rhodospirillales bacterium]
MIQIFRPVLSSFFAATILMSVGAAWAQQGEPKRSITQISGDLYRFQNNFHASVFLVTPEGVIVTDPINAEASKWLKAEIKTRFNQPVKFVIYSHDHRDHSSGGEVYADTALFVAHRNAKAAIVGENRPTAVPDITFDESLTIELGGKTVELTYVGPSHSDNMIVANFPAERTLFIVDIASVKRLLFKDLGDAYLPGWVNALKKVESLDYDRIAPGHGAMGTKADITANREYVEDLYNAVFTGLRAGKSLDELKQSIKLEKYKDWGQYEAWLPLNIEGAYRRISLQRRGN